MFQPVQRRPPRRRKRTPDPDQVYTVIRQDEGMSLVRPIVEGLVRLEFLIVAPNSNYTKLKRRTLASSSPSYSTFSVLSAKDARVASLRLIPTTRNTLPIERASGRTINSRERLSFEILYRRVKTSVKCLHSTDPRHQISKSASGTIEQDGNRSRVRRPS